MQDIKSPECKKVNNVTCAITEFIAFAQWCMWKHCGLYKCLCTIYNSKNGKKIKKESTIRRMLYLLSLRLCIDNTTMYNVLKLMNVLKHLKKKKRLSNLLQEHHDITLLGENSKNLLELTGKVKKRKWKKPAIILNIPKKNIRSINMLREFTVNKQCKGSIGGIFGRNSRLDENEYYAEEVRGLILGRKAVLK